MRLLSYVFISAILVTLLSCVKDTDFDQVDEILFTPEVELNLVFFNLDASYFFDTTTNTPRLTVRDTTALEFLDSDDITGSIQKIDFLFDFDNSIPRTFEVDVQFLRDNNNITYETGTVVTAGSSGSAIETRFVEVVVGEDLDNIELASKIVVSVTIPESDTTLTGNLSLQSKAIYFIEY